MSEDAGRDMKDRLRADLRAAMKDRRAIEARVIRTLVAAIDNAQAPPARAALAAALPLRFRSGAAEVERLLLSSSQVREVLLAEIHEREHAAAKLEQLEMMDRANALRAEALVARRYTA